MFISIETITEDVYSLLFGHDPFFTGEEIPNETDQHRKEMERLMWQKMLEGGFQRKALKDIRRMAKEGTIAAITFYNKEKKPIKDKYWVDEDDGIGGKIKKLKVETRDKYTKHYPDHITPQFLDWYFDPETPDEDAPDMFKWNFNIFILRFIIFN